MDEVEIRLRILEALIPQAARVEITDATLLVGKARQLTKFVTEAKLQDGAGTPDASPKRRGRRPKQVLDNQPD